MTAARDILWILRSTSAEAPELETLRRGCTGTQLPAGILHVPQGLTVLGGVVPLLTPCKLF